MEIKFGNRTIGLNHPTYFIADIAANTSRAAVSRLAEGVL